MDNLFKSFFTDNTPKIFEVGGEGPKPSQQDQGITEKPGGTNTGSEASNAGPKGDVEVARAQPPEANNPPGTEQTSDKLTFKDLMAKAKAEGENKTAESHRKWADRRKDAKEFAKAKWAKTKEVAREKTDIVKGLASKEMRGEVKGYINDKIDSANDYLYDKYDAAADNAAKRKDAAVDGAKERAGKLADGAKDVLVNKPKESIQKGGKRVKDYFVNKGRNIVDGIKADSADASAKYYDRKAERSRKKYTEKVIDLSIGDAKVNTAREQGRSRKVDRLLRKQDRVYQKGEAIRAKTYGSRDRAQQSKDSANQFRANVAGRK